MGRRVMNKRMRIYSLETKESLDLAFARNYVNHLVPALKKRMVMNVERTKSTTTTAKAASTNNENGNAKLAKIIRFEVDMALALSAKGFGWSHALEARLQRDYVMNINDRILKSFNSSSHKTSSFPNHPFTTLTIKTTAIFENKVCSSSALLPPNISSSQNPRCELKVMKKLSSTKSRRLGLRNGGPKKSQENDVNDKLAHLRTLLPGGSEMGDNGHELLVELASYITCLKLQVKVLQCLVEGHE